MDNGAAPSRLFQDLVSLEKDFKFNLSLLKVREAEIQRCSTVNQTLRDTLAAKLSEIAGLTARLSHLEEAFSKGELERQSEKQIHQQLVSRLTKDLEDTTHRYQERLEQASQEFYEKQAELQKFNSDVLRRKEDEFRDKLRGVEEDLARETSSGSKARNRIQALTDENASLRKGIRQLESQYTSETYFYKTEFSALQAAKGNLAAEMESGRRDLALLQEECERLRRHNAELNEQNRRNTEEIADLIARHQEARQDNAALRGQVEDKDDLREALARNSERLSRENAQLAKECAELKRVREEAKSEPHCNDPGHGDYEFVLKQNSMLRELVKAMRKERERYLAENQDAKQQLLKLDALKKAFKDGTVKELAQKF